MSEENMVTEVDVMHARAMADQGALLLDVREPDEWAAGHIADATHQPLGDLNLETCPIGRPIVAVCRSGNRSGKAAMLLAAEGREVVNMTGGMNAWSKAGLAVVADDGSPGTVA